MIALQDYQSDSACISSRGLCYPFSNGLSQQAAVRQLFLQYSRERATANANYIVVSASVFCSVIRSLDGTEQQQLAGVQIGQIAFALGAARTATSGSGNVTSPPRTATGAGTARGAPLEPLPGPNQIIIRAPGTEINGSIVAELTARGTRFNFNNLVATGYDGSGRIVFLEVGTATGRAPAGLAHVIADHGSQFATIGVSEAQLPAFLINTLRNGTIVGYQGRDTGRAIYEITHNGVRQRVAITVGDNGFIVGANPAGRVR